MCSEQQSAVQAVLSLGSLSQGALHRIKSPGSVLTLSEWRQQHLEHGLIPAHTSHLSADQTDTHSAHHSTSGSLIRDIHTMFM